ncbi:MAG: restriction endonuclease subunit S, partial [Gammaproteobacteria bacterium]
LEAMARALFKSWFVDFDPVRAKQPKNVGWVSPSGRNPPDKADGGLRDYAANPPYELPPHIADLFPDRLVDSELGQIPEGWKVTPLPDAVEVNPTRSSLRKGEVARYLDMANMPTRGHSPDEVVDRPFGSGMRFANGDTLVARITPCLENGKTAYVDFLEEGQIGWGSTEYIVLRPKPPLPEEFAYCLARSGEFRDFAIQSMTGSSGRQRVPAESLSHFQIVAPPKSISEHFGRLIKPLFARASAAIKASRTLADLRNTLLPKLISGELRVKDAERVAVGET